MKLQLILIITQSIISILKNKYNWVIFVFIINIFSNTLYSKTLSEYLSSQTYNKSLSFWHKANRLGALDKDPVIFSSNFSSNNLKYNYSLSIYSNRYKQIKFVLPIGYISRSTNNFELKIGRWSEIITNESSLSSGSLLISKNALPIPKISFRHKTYKNISIFNFPLSIKIGVSHGWMSKENYIKAPFLHEKYLYIKKQINNQTNLTVGLVDEAMWGGETESHGKQADSFSDFIRVITYSSAAKSGIPQERINSLGNHLGVWDISIQRIQKNLELKLYYQHPFEDRSGAYQYFFDEIKALKFPSKSLDGLFGIEMINNKSKFLQLFLYEYINTMNQSGREAASDSTYGWDNYYNHYIYQSGWVNQGRVIGNPLFTLGSNFGHYSNSNYIINNRIKAHHIGLSGNLSNKHKYKLFLTYSKNYGIYYDKNRFYNEKKIYDFERGIKQFSSLFELSFNNILKNIDISVSYSLDRGKLLNDNQGFLLVFYYKLTNLSSSQ
jgi:hypothetical protein